MQLRKFFNNENFLIYGVVDTYLLHKGGKIWRSKQVTLHAHVYHLPMFTMV